MLSDQLASIGETVSKKCARELYPMLATVLLTKGEDELTLMVVKQALLDKEH